MSTFTSAGSGTAQDVTQQNQWATSLNGGATATAPLAPYGGTTTIPHQASFATGVAGDQTLLQTYLTGDAGHRLFWKVRSSDGYGMVQQATGGGAVQGNWYAQSGPTWQTDQSVTVSGGGGATLDGTTTLNGSTTVNGAVTVSGTLSVTGTCTVVAPNLASGGLVETATAGVGLSVADDGTNVVLTAKGSRALLFSITNDDASTHDGWYVDPTGQTTINVGLGFVNGGSLRAISSATAQLVFTSCTPSCYGTATISHGLGMTPDACVLNAGDGGTGFATGGQIMGFSRLGSSTLSGWVSITGGSAYCNVLAFGN